MSLDSTSTTPEITTTSEETSAETSAGQILTLSPFYHSAVNAVTHPNKITHVSHYFIDRWMPLLGGNGTLIVLALRRDGFLNRKTGERRDEIVIGCAELAAAVGMSEDTLTRELGINKKTGKPQNPWLHHFVKKRSRCRRDKQGRIWREENAYWVAMDDPIHPDDEPFVQQAVLDAEARMKEAMASAKPGTFEALSPKPQNAGSVTVPSTPKPQNAGSSPQNAEPDPHFAGALKSHDFSLLQTTTSKDRTLNVSSRLIAVEGEEKRTNTQAEKPQSETADTAQTTAQPAENAVRVNEYAAIQNKQVMALIEELQDRGSERRHRQLLDLCDRHRLDALPQQALHATRKRLAQEKQKGALENPGAYYTRVLLTLLAQHQVFVPTHADAARLRAELGLPAEATAEDVYDSLRASLPPLPDLPDESQP